MEEISAEEIEFRKSEYPDDEVVLKKSGVDCTICKKNLRKAVVKNYELIIHPALQVLICDDCEEFYGDGEFSVDEDGSDKYCRWCGQGGNLYCCSNCSGAVCSKCVKKNLPKTYKKEIERDDWRCFTCDPKPIWSYRAVCAAAKSFVDNRETTQRSKRSRRAVDSGTDSDEEVFVKRTKKSRRESPSDDSRNETEDKHSKKPKDAQEKDENNIKPFSISLPKAKITNSTLIVKSDEESSSTRIVKKKNQIESDEESPSTSTLKKKNQKYTDSEESPVTSPAKRKSRRGGKLKVAFPPRRNPSRKSQEFDDSDESSSTSPVKPRGSRERRRNLDSKESFSTTSTKKTRSRKENLDSEGSLPPTPSKKKVSKDSDERPEKDLCLLLLKDTSKDLGKFSKIVATNTKQFEEKFLKGKEPLGPDKLSAAKDKLHQLLQDTTESIIALQNSFLNGLKTLDNDGEVVDRDNVENKTVDAVNGHRIDNEVTKKDSANKSSVENSVMDVTIESEKVGESDSSEMKRNDVGKESKNDEFDQETLDHEGNTTDASHIAQPSHSSPETSMLDSLHSTTDDPESSTTTAKLTNQEKDVEQELDESRDVNDDNSEKSKTTNPLHQECKSKHNGDSDENQDSSTLSNPEENRKGENQSEVSGGDLPKSNTDKVESKKSSGANELSDNDTDSNETRSFLSCNPEEEPCEGDAGGNSILDESSIIIMKKKEDRAKNFFLSSSSDNDESETDSQNVNEQKMNPESDDQSEVKEKDTSETRRSLSCNPKEESGGDDAEDRSIINNDSLDESSSIVTQKKESQAKKLFFSPSSDDDDESETDSRIAPPSTENEQKINSEHGKAVEETCESNDHLSEAETNKILRESPNERNPLDTTLNSNIENDETVVVNDEEAAKKDFLDSSSNSDESEKDTSKRGDSQKIGEKNSKNIAKNKENEAKKDILSDSGSNSDNNDVEETKLEESNNSSSKTLVKEELSDSHSRGDNSKEKTSNGPSKPNSKEIIAKKKFMLDTSSDSDNDSDENEKDIKKLSNLNNLNRRKHRHVYSSNDEVKFEEEEEEEPADQKKKRKLSLKKSNDKKLEQYLTDNDDSSSEDLSFANFKSQMQQKEKSYGSKDEVAKKLLLASQSSDDGLEESDDDEIIFARDVKEKKKTKKKVEEMDVDDSASDGDKKKKRSNSSEDDDEAKKKKRADWKNDRLLRGKLSATDTSDEERMIRRARKNYDQKEKKRAADSDSSGSDGLFRSEQQKGVVKKRRRVVLLSSDTDAEREIVETLSSAASSNESDKRKKKVKKRKRIKAPQSEDSDVEEINQSQSSLKGRKNIRQIMKKTDLDEQTRRTAKDEEARKKRLAERQALFNKVFEIQDTSDQVLKKLVLDYEIETKKELVTVDPKLLAQLKPHQVKGVRFMWEACFESLKQVQNGKGGGCILAHCMGLGKTLQVITLVHTLLSHKDTKVKTILIICPLTTVFNWRSEFDKWLEGVDDYEDINVYDLTKYKNNAVRADHLKHWKKNGGVMILGYESFRSIVNGKKLKADIRKSITASLLDPGPDLVICDEGHILKNEKSAISKATMEIKSLRRIVLTGTPLQNNLKEYHCMMQFVKPNLLGNQKEFQNRFVGPITNGQYVDSTSKDVRLMKRRAHVLHKMLDGIVQRFDYNVLKPFLPPKFEFVISVGLSDLQAQLYEYYIKNKSQLAQDGVGMRLFKDYQIMRLIWTHPLAMKLSADRRQKIQEKEESDESMKNFVVSDSESESNHSDSVVSVSSGDETNKNKRGGRLTRAKRNELGIDLDEVNNSPPEVSNHWWNEFVSEEDLEDYRKGPKLMLLFAILRQCELIGDKVLIFSQSIPSLDMIEYFLTKNEEFSQRLPQDSSFVGEAEDYVGVWHKNIDYFRLDGQTPNELRSRYCKIFNRPNNTRARLFLISTKAGGLGINLPAANRVIIFDASWNPSYDIQSIFRVYRFGQTKPCYIYRFLSQGTMEEKIYERQVTKLSVSCRVVDEQQIDRHFSRKDVAELYTFNRKPPMLDEIPKLPSDRLMAEMLKQYKDVIISYHEHDSLLENIEDEELTEEERKAAWKDYEDEKNRPALAAQQRISPAMVYQEMASHMNDEMILSTIRKTHPNATQPQLMIMLNTVRQKLFDYYMFEQQRRVSTQVHTAVPSTSSIAPPIPMTERQMPERPMADQLQMKQDALLRALQQPSGQVLTQPTFVNYNPTSSNPKNNAEEVASTSEPRDPLA